MRHLFTAKENNNLRRGFTLLETLVAISILTLSIGGAFSVVQSGLSSAITARDQVIAFQLAQEGVELVKNVRDTNTYLNQGWLQGLTQCEPVEGCGIDPLLYQVRTCGTINSCKIFRNADGYYIQSSASGLVPTPFSRKIRILPVAGSGTIANTRQVKIVVTMSWVKGLLVKNFTVTDYMFDWQKP